MSDIKIEIVKWTWSDDPGHFIIKLGDGIYCEFQKDANIWVDYKDTSLGVNDSVLILIDIESFDQPGDDVTFVKLTDSMIYFSDTVDGLDSTLKAYPGAWESVESNCFNWI